MSDTFLNQPRRVHRGYETTPEHERRVDPSRILDLGRRSGMVKTIQAAADYIYDRRAAGETADPERPWTIRVHPGDVWRGRDAVLRMGSAHMSHVNIVGESPQGSLFILPGQEDDPDYYVPNDDTSDPSSQGGTWHIGPDPVGGTEFPATLLENVSFYGLHIVNQLAGSAGKSAQGGPPEAALFIGVEDANAGGRYVDQAMVQNCRLEGVHDGIQFFGSGEDWFNVANGDPDNLEEFPMRIWQLGNEIFSCHDAVTIKGDMMVFSAGNVINTKDDGPSPLLQVANGASIADWKLTGMHINVDLPTSGMVERHPRARVVSMGDIYNVINTGTFGVTTGGGGQEMACGLLLYNGSGLTLPVYWHGCSVFVQNYQDDSFVEFGAILCAEQGNVPKGSVVINGCNLDVRQEVNGANNIGAYGIWAETAGGGSDVAAVHAHSNTIKVFNADAGGDADAVHADATTAGDTATIFTDQNNSVVLGSASGTSGSGTAAITADTSV